MGIYNSLPIVARALSSQIGLNVSVGGNEAYATETGAGFLINLPFFKDAEMLANPLLGMPYMKQHISVSLILVILRYSFKSIWSRINTTLRYLDTWSIFAKICALNVR